MPERMVAFLRSHDDGVTSLALAGEFLKFKAPDERLAHTMVSAVLAAERRVACGPDGLWRAAAAALPADDTRLRELPWSAMSVLCAARRLMHVSVWSVLPEPALQCSVWLHDPATLAPEEQELLRSGLDAPFDAQATDEALQRLSDELSERVPVFLSGAEEGQLAWRCRAGGIMPGDHAMLLSRLARAAGRTLPRPLVLEELARELLGGAAAQRTAAGRGKLLAECTQELIARLEQSGIETRDALEQSLQRELYAFDFSGRKFDAERIASLAAAPGVYGFTDAGGAYVYIGKASNLRRRVSGYFSRSDESPAKLQQLRDEAIDLVVVPCGSELESLIYEQRLIRKYRPRLNTQVEIRERRGQYRPIDDCVVLLPHAEERKGVSVWLRRGQKIQLRTFNGDFSATESLQRELEQFFFSEKLAAAPTDFTEQEIAQRWLSRRFDTLAVVPVSRMASGGEVLQAMRLVWSERPPA